VIGAGLSLLSQGGRRHLYLVVFGLLKRRNVPLPWA